MSPTDEEAKELFAKYLPQNETEWTRESVASFLKDLQADAGLPRVVPDESIRIAQAELQIGSISSGSLSWVDFKSFLILHATEE